MAYEKVYTYTFLKWLIGEGDRLDNILLEFYTGI